MIETKSADGIDLTSPEFFADPYPTYARLLESGAPFWQAHGGSTGGMWLVSRYQDALMLLKEGHTTKDAMRVKPAAEVTFFDHTMLSKDAPEHTRLRSLASLAFTPARVRDMAARLAQIIDELIGRVASQGRMDFIADFAMPLPAIVIAELLGVPPEDRETFHSWSEKVARGTVDELRSEAAAEEGDEAGKALAYYFSDLFDRRREEPKDDLISALIAAHYAQDRLTEIELMAMCMGLLIAGHTTTANLLGNGMLTLLRNPDQMAMLQSHPDLLPSAVEEMLRFESPIQRATFRLTKVPVEIGGTLIPKGQQVSVLIGAANRDPQVFPQPDRFDISRQPNRHLAFGFGAHFCFGAPLARAQTKLGFSRLLERLPRLRLSAEGPRWGRTTFFRGLDSLPVEF
jgi:cytochrome P450